MAPGAEIHFQRVVVWPWQIETWNLPTRPTKATDSRARRWTGGESVELDAIEAPLLREMVERKILDHVDTHSLQTLKAAEASERNFLAHWAEMFGRRYGR